MTTKEIIWVSCLTFAASVVSASHVPVSWLHASSTLVAMRRSLEAGDLLDDWDACQMRLRVCRFNRRELSYILHRPDALAHDGWQQSSDLICHTGQCSSRLCAHIHDGVSQKLSNSSDRTISHFVLALPDPTTNIRASRCPRCVTSNA